MSDNAPWSVWFDRTGMKVKCSTCGQEIDMALVFPDHGLKICFGCLGRMGAVAEIEVAAEIAKKESAR